MTLSSCGLARAPINILNRMIHSRGNMLRMRGDNTRMPDDFKLQPGDVNKALADAEITEPPPEVVSAGFALR